MFPCKIRLTIWNLTSRAHGVPQCLAVCLFLLLTFLFYKLMVVNQQFGLLALDKSRGRNFTTEVLTDSQIDIKTTYERARVYKDVEDLDEGKMSEVLVSEIEIPLESRSTSSVGPVVLELEEKEGRLSMKNGTVFPRRSSNVGNPHLWHDSKIGAVLEVKNRQWFMKNGTLFPKPNSSVGNPNLWYDSKIGCDRIVDQLMFATDDPINQIEVNDSSVTEEIPKNLSRRSANRGNIKTILLYNGLRDWDGNVVKGRHTFLQQKCPVNACRITSDRSKATIADLVMWKNGFSWSNEDKRPPGQLWGQYLLESPKNLLSFEGGSAINLSMTYRHDSDIVTPYEKWAYYDDNVRSLPQTINYAEGKTKGAAAFISNCRAKNRLQYANELKKHFPVDIYGLCGDKTCPKVFNEKCFEMVKKDYKFYLSFENSNCRDYITEKFFVNALGNNVIPIAMGAHPNDYKRAAPQNSYIHVEDFASPKDLAEYLHKLDGNDIMYNEYFRWKGTGEFINTYFFCRLCAIAHYAEKFPKKPNGHYKDFGDWWKGENVCTSESRWGSQPDIFAGDYAPEKGGEAAGNSTSISSSTGATPENYI